MTFQNSAAYDSDTGLFIPTKKELKERILKDPYSVTIEGTSPLSPTQHSGPAADLPKNITYSVVGPDPWHKRNWFATLAFNEKKKAWIVT